MPDRTATAPLDPQLLVYGLETPLDPQLSPDGMQILYRLLTADADADAARSRLVVCAWEGTDARPLTETGHLDSLGRWSPDGRSVAFVSDRAGGHGVFVVDAAGGEPRELARHRRPLAGLTWSPDGTRLAYTCAVDPEDPAHGRDEDPRGPTVRVTRRDDYRLDGVGFIGEARPGVFLVDLAGGGPRRLTPEGTDFVLPQWSPDGRLIAAAVGPYYRARLGLVEVDTGQVTLVGPAGGQVPLWAWSPTGDRIVLVADPGRTYQADFYLHHLDSGRTVQVTDDPGVQPHASVLPVSQPPAMPVWLDESRIAFSGARAGTTGLYVVDCRSGEVELLRGWQAVDHGFSADRERRRFVFAQTSLERPSELVTLERERGAPAVVTAHSAALHGRPGPDWERLDVVRGDVRVQAWLLKPADFDPARRHPMVLDVHGGPNGWYGHGFLPVQQCLASHGFLVAYANPRGSATYGRRFAGMVLGDWGGEDFEDLMAVVDTLAARPYVDADRLGIYGYSYGGYMTATIIGRTDRFRAAVCGAPCFDLVSHWGTSDIGDAWDDVQWTGPPHERVEWYRDRSPSTFAHRTRTPTLIVQGEADDRCPIGQSQHLFTVLRHVGCETELALYPGASHLFIGTPETRPSQRADYLARVLGWFEDHL